MIDAEVQSDDEGEGVPDILMDLEYDSDPIGPSSSKKKNNKRKKNAVSESSDSDSTLSGIQPHNCDKENPKEIYNCKVNMINLEFENKKLQLLINKLNEKLKSEQISFREQQPSTFGQQVNKTPSITPTVITANSYEALGNQDDDIYSNTQEYIAQLTKRQKQKQH